MYEHLFKDLEPTEPEAKLIEAAAQGVPWDSRTGDENEDDPANAENWGEERNLRAEVIFALLVEGRADWPVHPKGIWIHGAQIIGWLDLSDAELVTPLYLLNCHLASPLILTDCRAKSVILSGSHVSEISGDRLVVSGSLYLRDKFTSSGEVRFPGATVGGDFDCSESRFENIEEVALNAQNIVVNGTVYLRKFAAKSEVSFYGATISGSFDCNEATFENKQGPALNAENIDVNGRIDLRKITAKGSVSFLGATIGGAFDCREATFENKEGQALNGDNLDIKGSILLHRCNAKGETRFVGAVVGGSLICSDATFVCPTHQALALQEARIARTLWLNFAQPPEGILNLQYASAGQLYDSDRTWPATGNLVLVGFEYGAFAGHAPTGWEDRLRWLKRQRKSHLTDDFRPQPWEQLIAVLRRMGHDSDARKIAIAKQDALIKAGNRSWRWRLWHGFLGETIKYGYESWRALIWMAVMILIGTIIFRDANRADLIVPAKERVYLDHRYEATQGKWLPPEYPAFSPLVYAADVFVPILDLHQETHWRPTTIEGGWGWAVTIFMWFYILLGWVFTTLAVAGLTGVVRQRAER